MTYAEQHVFVKGSRPLQMILDYGISVFFYLSNNVDFKSDIFKTI